MVGWFKAHVTTWTYDPSQGGRGAMVWDWDLYLWDLMQSVGRQRWNWVEIELNSETPYWWPRIACWNASTHPSPPPIPLKHIEICLRTPKECLSGNLSISSRLSEYSKLFMIFLGYTFNIQKVCSDVSYFIFATVFFFLSNLSVSVLLFFQEPSLGFIGVFLLFFSYFSA